jgi:hypothetical protein
VPKKSCPALSIGWAAFYQRIYKMLIATTVMKFGWKNWNHPVKGAVIGGVAAGILGMLLAWIIGFSQESVSIVTKLFLMGLISGGFLSWAHHKSKKIKKPSKETYAWIGAVIGGGVFLLPPMINIFGLLSGTLITLPLLIIENFIGFNEVLEETLFWAMHLTLGCAIGYTIGYFIRR